MKKCIVIAVSMMLSLGITHNIAWGQDTGSAIYKIEMRNGNVFFGTIVSENEQLLVLRTDELGEIELQKSDIKSREAVDPDRFKNGKYWFDNPHGTRYLFSTSAIGLKKGEGYYQNTWIFFNNVNYGFSSNISIGAGLIPVFLFGGGATPVWVLPKVSVPLAKDKLHLAVGGMFGGIVGVGESYGVGLAYGAATAGNLDRNITLAVGFGYGGGQWSDIPLFNISYMSRLNRTIYFISENYIISVAGETAGFLSGAIRWAPENIAIDFGLFRPYIVGENLNEDMGIGIPWLGVSIPFGK